MPHCLIEYSKNIETSIHSDKLLDTVFDTVASSPLFAPENVSARLYPHQVFREGNGKNHFINVVIKLYPGRTDEQKTELTRQVGEAIQQLGLTDVLISCECSETHKVSMHRAVID